MRYFKCSDCGHIWMIIFWEDGKGTKMACPECKSLSVHQIEKVRGWDREGKYASPVKDEGFHQRVSEREPEQSNSLDTDSLPHMKPTQRNTNKNFYQRILNGVIERFVKHSP